jgi:hypothetical protein
LRVFIIYITSLIFLGGCNFLKKKEEQLVEESTGKPIARVYNKYLFYEDIEGIQGKNLSKEDSSSIVNTYINSWILKQLLLMRAEGQIDENDEEIKQRIEECKNTLLLHEFEKNYLKQKLDTNFSEQELRSYYDSNIENFELKQNIFKGVFVKVPKDAPELGKMKALVSSGKPRDLPELKSLCVRFASQYILEDTVWINFDDLVKNSPSMMHSDKAEFLEKNRQAEITDGRFIYLFKIKDYKISKQISPYDFVKGQIRNTLLNKRRTELINQLKLSIYKEAKNNNEFEIFGKK